jgi:mannose-6-phosphate isomerase-like protein (cupin superfamily)
MAILANNKQKLSTTKGKNFTAIDLGPWESLDQYKLTFGDRTVAGKVFLKEELDLTGVELSFNKFPGGRSMPFLHQHKENEEVYIFIAGHGQMQIDGQIVDVAPGTSVRVAPEGKRAFRSKEGEDLYFICLQVKNNSLSDKTIEDGIRVNEPVVWPE